MRKHTVIWIIAVLLVLVLLIWFGKTGTVRDLPEIQEEGHCHA